MKLQTLKSFEVLNNETISLITGGTSATVSKKNDIKTDSDRTDGGGCIPPHNQ
jgi:hypothetical protein|tara:strand:+ start:218 stop:376 length:159 start_codon:yes stop_codon:yes gene_type:complete